VGIFSFSSVLILQDDDTKQEQNLRELFEKTERNKIEEYGRK
jgi:hypothetical protein